MKQETFFPGAARRVTLGSPTLQTSNRRICIPIAMPLSDEPIIGMPDWVGEAFTAVSNHFSHVDPEVEQLVDLTLHFSNDKPKGELFAAPSAKVPGAELRKFEVLRTGEPEDPEVQLHFKAYTPFTRDFWNWIGEMAGKEVYMAFPSSLGQGVAVAPPQPKLIDNKPSQAEVEVFANDTKPEDGPGSTAFEDGVRKSMGAPEPFSEKPRLVGDNDATRTGKKSGPKELRKFHEQQADRKPRSRTTVN